jgi:nucleoside phosphorylase
MGEPLEIGMPRLAGRYGSALVAVITILDEEFHAVRAVEKFTAFVDDTPYFFRNKIAHGHYDAILAQSADRSNTPCAELVADLAERFRPEFIILSGIAGGIGKRDGVALGDVIVADHIEGYEMRKFQEGRGMTRRLALDHPSKYLRETIARRVRLSDDWKRRIGIAPPQPTNPKVIIGNLIAGDKILGDGENEYQKKILAEFDKAIAVDMESHGLARGAYSARGARYYNLNYLVVRGISDLVNESANDATKAFGEHRGSRRSGSEFGPARRPVPGQKLIKVLDGVISDAGERIGEPSLWVHVVELRRRNQCHHDGGAVGATFGAGEEP